MAKIIQMVILATVLLSVLAGPAANLMADGGGPWPPPKAPMVIS